MARPRNLWLSPASLAKVDDDNYRAFIIDKAHLPSPENQSGSKRLIADTMMAVGIEVDPVDITYAPAPVATTSKSISVWRFMSFLLICWQVVGTEYDYLRATTR